MAVVVGEQGNPVTLTVDQSSGGGQWHLLGTFQLDAASEVVIHAARRVTACADAAMFERVDPLPAEDPVEPTPDEPPMAPVDLTSQANGGFVSLTWSPNVEGDVAFYAIYRSTSPDEGFVLVSESASDCTFTDAGVMDGSTYYYYVSAIDLAGNESEPSVLVSATPNTTACSVTLAWDRPLNADGTPQESVVGYRIYYGAESQQNLASIFVGNVTSWTIEDLEPGTYFFTVTARDVLDRESDRSNEVSATLP